MNSFKHRSQNDTARRLTCQAGVAFWLSVANTFVSVLELGQNLFCLSLGIRSKPLTVKEKNYVEHWPLLFKQKVLCQTKKQSSQSEPSF